jgi:hypothetical protein
MTVAFILALAGVAVVPAGATGSNASDDVYIHPEAQNAGGEVMVLLGLENATNETPQRMSNGSVRSGWIHRPTWLRTSESGLGSRFSDSSG